MFLFTHTSLYIYKLLNIVCTCDVKNMWIKAKCFPALTGQVIRRLEIPVSDITVYTGSQSQFWPCCSRPISNRCFTLDRVRQSCWIIGTKNIQVKFACNQVFPMLNCLYVYAWYLWDMFYIFCVLYCKWLF